MRIRFIDKPTSLEVSIDVPHAGTFRLVDDAGAEVGSLLVAGRVEEKRPAMRPPEPMPDGFDVEKERRRMTQGGCCGQGTEG